MSARSASEKVGAKVAAKAVRANGTKRRAKKIRMSRLESRRLEDFKALMLKYGGKGVFAGYDG